MVARRTKSAKSVKSKVATAPGASGVGAAGKPAKAAKPAGKASSRAPLVTAPAPASATTPPPGDGPAPRAKLERKVLLERVSEATGMPRNTVRKVLDAALAEMRAALGNGVDLALPPFARVRIKKVREGRDGEFLICRVKLAEPTAQPAPEPASDPLAKPVEGR